MRTHSEDDSKRLSQLRTSWSETETLALCDLYQQMLDLESQGLLGASKSQGQTSKAVLVRSFITDRAPSRSKGSVEAKLMNLSAVRAECGLPLVTGYKALPNMSTSCWELACQYWGQH